MVGVWPNDWLQSGVERASGMRLLWFVTLLSVVALPVRTGLAQTTVDESFFVETLYPMLHAAQCVRCHSDNGVASETALEFPRAEAPNSQITAFGLSLVDYVDRKKPDES